MDFLGHKRLYFLFFKGHIRQLIITTYSVFRSFANEQLTRVSRSAVVPRETLGHGFQRSSGTRCEYHAVFFRARVEMIKDPEHGEEDGLMSPSHCRSIKNSKILLKIYAKDQLNRSKCSAVVYELWITRIKNSP